MAKKVKIDLEVNANGAVRGVRAADGQLKKLNRSAGKVKSTVSGLGGVFQVAMGSLAAGAVAGLTASLGRLVRGGIRLLNESVQARGIQLIAERKLETALINLGDGAEHSAPQLKALASELQGVTNFGDESIITAQAMLATFKDVSGPEGLGILTPRLLDMAAGLQKTSGEAVDLNNVAQAVGKALSNGSGALSRYGISLSDVQKEAFDTSTGLEKVNMLAEILDANFAGLAESVADPFVQMQNAAGDLQEQIGAGLRPVMAGMAKDIQEQIESDQFQEFARIIGEDIGGAIETVWTFLKENAGTIRAAGVEMGELWENFEGMTGAMADAIDLKTGDSLYETIFGNTFLEDLEATNEQLETVTGWLETYNRVLDEVWQSISGIDMNLVPDIAPLSSHGGIAPLASHGAPGAAPVESGTPGGATGGSGTAATSAPPRPAIEVSGAPDSAQEKFDLLMAEAAARREITAAMGEQFSAVEILLEQKGAEMQATMDAQSATNQETLALERQRLAREALTEAMAEQVAAQIAAVDTSIKTGDDAVNAILAQVRTIIQAKLAETIAANLASLGPAALFLGPAVAVGLNLLFNNLMPKFAGGVTGFGGGMALVGERGPELVTMGTGSNVITNQNTSRILASMGQGSMDAGMVAEMRKLRTTFDRKQFGLSGIDLETSQRAVAGLYSRAGIR